MAWPRDLIDDGHLLKGDLETMLAKLQRLSIRTNVLRIVRRGAVIWWSTCVTNITAQGR